MAFPANLLPKRKSEIVGDTHMSDWRKRIQVDPTVCHGKPCIKGTRIMVSVVLNNLASGESIASILATYPGLVRKDVLASLRYAADLANDRTALFADRPPT